MMLEFLFANAVRATVVLLIALLVSFALRRASAAVRHFVWTSALACLLALPALSLIVPAWRLELARPASKPAVATAVAQIAAEVDHRATP